MSGRYLAGFKCDGCCGPLLNGRERRGDEECAAFRVECDGFEVVVRGHPFCWEVSLDDGGGWDIYHESNMSDAVRVAVEQEERRSVAHYERALGDR